MAQGVTTKNDHSLFHGHCGRAIFHTVLKKRNSGIIFYFNLCSSQNIKSLQFVATYYEMEKETS